MLLSNANQQPEVTGLTGVNLIGLDAGDAWCQVPADLVIQHPLRVQAISTTTHTATAADSGTCFTNAGASGTVTITLPPALVGMQLRALVRTNTAFRLDPNGTEVIAHVNLGAGDPTGGKYIGVSTNQMGASIHLICTANGRWDIHSSRGTWVNEP